MKNYFYLLLVGLLVIGQYSCGTDPIVDTPVAPTIEFMPGAGFITADASGISSGSTVKTKIIAAKGNSNLKVLSINWRRNGQLVDSIVDPTTLKIDGVAATANPKLILASTELSGFTNEISFPVSNSTDTITYIFRIEDSNNLKDEVSFTIYSVNNSVTTLTGKKLFNKAGPAGTGGIDLHTGNSTGSADPTAELSDLGNDVSLDWKKQFVATNPTETTIKSIGSGFIFNSLTSKSDIVDAYDGGTSIGATISPAIGNVYVIKSGIFYFAIKITNLVDIPGGGVGKNDDYFELDIKQ